MKRFLKGYGYCVYIVTVALLIHFYFFAPYGYYHPMWWHIVGDHPDYSTNDIFWRNKIDPVLLTSALILWLGCTIAFKRQWEESLGKMFIVAISSYLVMGYLVLSISGH